MPISSDLQFHLQGIDDPDETWEKLETIFGKYNEIRAHQLENHRITLCHEHIVTVGLPNYKCILMHTKETHFYLMTH
jgi:hypothetical protein